MESRDSRASQLGQSGSTSLHISQRPLSATATSLAKSNSLSPLVSADVRYFACSCIAAEYPTLAPPSPGLLHQPIHVERSSPQPTQLAPRLQHSRYPHPLDLRLQLRRRRRRLPWTPGYPRSRRGGSKAAGLSLKPTRAVVVHPGSRWRRPTSPPPPPLRCKTPQAKSSGRCLPASRQTEPHRPHHRPPPPCPISSPPARRRRARPAIGPSLRRLCGPTPEPVAIL